MPDSPVDHSLASEAAAAAGAERGFNTAFELNFITFVLAH